jgi:hypothetical protein
VKKNAMATTIVFFGGFVANKVTIANHHLFYST